MNTAIDLNRISANAPVLVPIRRKGKQRDVSNLVQPVRDIVKTETVVAVPAGARGSLRPPEGYIYTAAFMDGTKRELFVESDGEGKQYFDAALFLKEGRKSNLLAEIRTLEIHDLSDRPSKQLVDRMKKDALARGAGASIAPCVK